MSTKIQHIKEYTKKNGTVVAGYDRVVQCRASHTTHCNNSSQSNNYRQLGRLTKLEEEYANNIKNFNDEYDYNKMQKKLKEGKKLHDKGEYEKEAQVDRSIQEDIQKQGGLDKYDKDSKEVYAWNSLYVHHGGFMEKMIEKGGFSFNDIVEYSVQNGKGRYYLKEDAYNYAIRNGYSFYDSGKLSIVDPNCSFGTKEKFVQSGGYRNVDSSNVDSGNVSSYDRQTSNHNTQGYDRYFPYSTNNNSSNNSQTFGVSPIFDNKSSDNSRTHRFDHLFFDNSHTPMFDNK